MYIISNILGKCLELYFSGIIKTCAKKYNLFLGGKVRCRNLTLYIGLYY